jgi:GDP-4-dehydro-6-deoxy-D-mannose reductase
VNVLLTGAGGFTATHLIRRLREEKGFILTGTGLRPDAPNARWLDHYLPADLSDFQQASRVIQQARPDWIFNLAGLVRGTAHDLYRVNLLGAVNVLEAAKAAAPEAAILLVGSAAEYGLWPDSHMPLAEDHECRPVGPYGLSKHAMTLAALDHARAGGAKVIVARPFNLIGAGMPTNLVAGAIAQRIRLALAHGDSSITIGNAATQRDFIAVEDAVDAYVKLLRCAAWGQVFNICSGVAHSIQTVIDMLLAFSPRSLRVVEDDSLKRPNDPLVVVGDGAKVHRLCQFSPRVELPAALRAAWDGISEPAVTNAGR